MPVTVRASRLSFTISSPGSAQEVQDGRVEGARIVEVRVEASASDDHFRGAWDGLLQHIGVPLGKLPGVFADYDQGRYADLSEAVNRRRADRFGVSAKCCEKVGVV